MSVNAIQDVKNFIKSPNWASLAGIVGTSLGLPEFHVSEANAAEPIGPESGMAGQTVTPFSSNGQTMYSTGGGSTPSVDYSNAFSTPGATNTTVKKTGTTGTTGGGGGADLGAGVKNINDSASSGNSLIDQDYENTMSVLSGQEQVLRGQGQAAENQITSEAGNVTSQLGREQSTKQAGVESQLSTAENVRTSQMQSARDVFRQVQGENTAKLSALGISSSSVAEALAENLGIATARRIAGIEGTAAEIRQNATKEIAGIKNYFQEKITGVAQWVADQKVVLQNSLMAGLGQIAAARGQAAQAKAQQRAQLLSDVRTQIYNLTSQAQQFQQSLQAWAAQKADAVQPYLNEEFVNKQLALFSSLQQQYPNQDLSLNIEPSKTGGETSYGIVNKKKTEDELNSQNVQSGLGL
jgi:hypothetical protein